MRSSAKVVRMLLTCNGRCSGLGSSQRARVICGLQMKVICIFRLMQYIVQKCAAVVRLLQLRQGSQAMHSPFGQIRFSKTFPKLFPQVWSTCYSFECRLHLVNLCLSRYTGSGQDVMTHVLQRLGRAANMNTVSLEVSGRTSLSCAETPITVSESIAYGHKAGVVEASGLYCHCKRADKKIRLLLINRWTALLLTSAGLQVRI